MSGESRINQVANRPDPISDTQRDRWRSAQGFMDADQVVKRDVYPDIDVPAWLAPGQRKRLGKAIVALKEQFGLPSSFAKHLEQFRQQRNEFTHNIWRDGDAPLRVGSELTKMPLHRTARELSKLFSDLLMKAHEIRFQVATKMLEDEIDVFKRRWPS